MPRIPKKIMGAGGPITIQFRKPKMQEGIPKTEDSWATWDDSTRIIEVDSGASAVHQWRVFFHEVTHAMLADSGLENIFDDKVVEAICDANATARMRERFR